MRPLTATGVTQGKQTDASKGGMDDIAVLVITGAGMERKRLDHEEKKACFEGHDPSPPTCSPVATFIQEITRSEAPPRPYSLQSSQESSRTLEREFSSIVTTF